MARYGELPVKFLNVFSEKASSEVAFLADSGQIYAVLKASGRFDSEFYLCRYPDIKAAGVDPLAHYIKNGWREGRNPNLWLDSDFYLRDNPDIAEKIGNPLLHFICTGYKEGRRPNPECEKHGKRLLPAILTNGMSADDATLLARRIVEEDPSAHPVIAITDAGYPDQGIRLPFAVLKHGIQILASDKAMGSLWDIFRQFGDDYIFLVNPLAPLPRNLREILDAAIRKNPAAIQVFQNGFGIFADGELRLSLNRDGASEYFPVPIIGFGTLLPPGFATGLLKREALYRKYAPGFSGIWLAVEAMLAGISMQRLPGRIASANHSLCGEFNSRVFKRQLQVTLTCFRREFDKTFGAAILERLYKKELCEQYRERAGNEIDWAQPAGFSEKLQRLKLLDDLPLKTLLADKYRARSYIRAVAGEQYLTRLLGVWKSAEDIDYSKLPDKFVLKTNHGSNQNIIVPDKAKLDPARPRTWFKRWLNTNFALEGYEINYFDIEPLIICEEYLGHDIPDYKILCFNSKPAYIWVDHDRSVHHTRNFYTADWRKLSISCSDCEAATIPSPKPAKLELMLELAAKLSAPFRHSRIDFFVLPDESLKIGEITFYSWSGYISFQPASFNVELGALII